MEISAIYQNGVHESISKRQQAINGKAPYTRKNNRSRAAQYNPAKIVENIYHLSRRVIPVNEDLVIESMIAQETPFWKRCMDVLFAVLALVALSPIFVLVALFILIVSPGPVIFKQIRVGKAGEPFTIFKFRTMKINADASVHKDHFKNLIDTDNAMQKLDAGHDPRIIPFGNLLRQAGVDELPQLLNVIRGEMSIVGPRPCLPYEAEKYLRWQHNRFDVLPGLTGLWQVSGKNRTTFKQMIRMDITYSRDISFWQDVRILFMTLPAILAQMKG